MYDHFEGRVVHKDPAGVVVVRAGGIGFEIRTSRHSFDRVRPGHDATLYVHMHVTDGTPTLLGFATRGERDLCRKLLSVSNVGPAIALAVLSAESPARVARAIMRGDTALLTRVKGVGQKTASRLVLELKDALAALAFDEEPGAGPTVELDRAGEDAVAALVTLGFAEREARRRVEQALGRQRDLPAEDLIRLVLRESAGSERAARPAEG